MLLALNMFGRPVGYNVALATGQAAAMHVICVRHHLLCVSPDQAHECATSSGQVIMLSMYTIYFITLASGPA